MADSFPFNTQLFITSDGFVASLGSYSQFRESSAETNNLRERHLRMRVADVSSRVLNLWEEAGILPTDTRDGAGWRKFSLTDLVWLELVKRMTSSGLQLTTIQQGMKSLSTPNTLDLFHVEHGLAFVLGKKKQFTLYFVATKDGQMQFIDKASFDAFSGITFASTSTDSLLLIVVNKLVEKLLGRKGLTPIEVGIQLDSTETSILNELSNPGVESINVKKHKDKVVSYETEEKLSEKEVAKHLKELQYGELTLKRQNAKTVHVIKKKQVKL
jgi:DNA-binding transcriptional MerR regulator